MSTPQVTAVVNAHSEGLLAQPSIKSLGQARARAEQNGIQVEVVVVLDRPTAVTEEFFSDQAHLQPWLRLVTVNFGDPGLSRNAGVSAAAGDWIAFLDADDLWGANWLVAAHSAAEADARSIVWHPEVNVYFGAEDKILVHVDMESPQFDVAGLAVRNYWTALCFAKRAFLLSVPYPATNLGHQIGYEDWGWNMETIARGALHKVVPGTGHVIRVRAASVVRRTTEAECLPRPSEMFCQLLKNGPPRIPVRL